MASLLVPPGLPILNSNGDLVTGAKIYVYDAGTTNDATTYQDFSLSSAHPQPIVASAGYFPPIYVSGGQEYKIDVKTSADASLGTGWPHDNWPPAISSDSAAVPVASGGTGATTAAAARTNLGAAAASDLTTLSSTVTSATTPQDTATWETGTGTTESVVSPAKVKAAIEALEATQSGVPDIVLEYQETSGTAAQAMTNAYATVPLNTEVRDNGGIVSISSGEFTTTKQMWVEWMAQGYSCQDFKSRCTRTSDSAVMGYSTSARGLNSSNDRAIVASVEGGVLLAAGTYKIEVRADTTSGKLGTPSSLGTEIYARLKGWVVHGG